MCVHFEGARVAGDGLITGLSAGLRRESVRQRRPAAVGLPDCVWHELPRNESFCAPRPGRSKHSACFQVSGEVNASSPKGPTLFPDRGLYEYDQIRVCLCSLFYCV